MSSLSPLVAAFLTLDLTASDTPVGPKALCPACGSLLRLGTKAVVCPDCRFQAVGEPWEIAKLARAAVPPPPPAPKSFPYVIDRNEAFDDPPDLPEELVPGLLSRGNKMVLGGGSKSGKTWSLIHLALCMATGTPWWGYPITRRRRVLYLNLEIQRPYFIQRVNVLKVAMGIEGPVDLDVIHLRGLCDDHCRLLPNISEFLQSTENSIYDAITLDPLYKMLHGSESDQEYVSALVDSIERFGERHEAATIYGAHFPKGDAFEKAPMDRIAGSGVIARDADVISIVTKVPEEADLFVNDTILRNFAPVASRGLRWAYPLMVPENAPLRDPGANSRGHGQSTTRPTRKPVVPTPEDVAAVLRQVGGTAPAGDRLTTSLVFRLREMVPGTNERDARTAIAQAEGVTIQYTGTKARKETYTLK